MSHQIPLLSRSPVARYADPDTSHQAAREVTQDGSRARQQNLVLGAIKRWPGKTTAELAVELRTDRFTVARRAPELRASNYVENGAPRTCEVTSKQSLTWWIRGTAPPEAA